MFTAYIVVLAVMSVIALVVFGRDKVAATQGWSRTPEMTLITLSALGGAVGALLGTIIFRHKSNFGRKFYIHIAIWLSLAIQAAVLVYGLLVEGGIL